MKIDWAALGTVSIVSLVATVLVVTVFALGVAAFGNAQDKVKAAESGTGYRVLGYACFAAASLAVLYGIYLIVPVFH